MWQLSGSDLPGTSYLFGTMHVHDSRAFFQMPLLQQCLAECEVFVAEYNLDETLNASGSLVHHFVSTEPWVPDLGVKKFQKIRKSLLKATGFDIEPYQQLLPFFIVQQLSIQMLPFQEDQPLDVALWTHARETGKQMEGLESFEGQLEYIHRIPLQKQIKMLVDFGRNITTLRKHYLHLVHLYQQQEIYRLHRSLKKQSGHFRKLLLYERNFKMAARIVEYCQANRAFIAVGAGHLTGGKGLLRLLKHKGIDVKAVTGNHLLNQQNLPAES